MININATPLFEYHISGVSEALTKKSPLWNLPLLGKDAGGILLHEYFQLAEKFISSNNYYLLQQGLQSNLKKGCKVEDIIQIDIHLEKHGAFYHPAKIEVGMRIETPICFVLNTAVSAHGLALINNEYNILKSLNEIDDDFFVPKVFGVETMTCRGMQISFLLGTWFDGYKEFHWTGISNSDAPNSCEIDNTIPSVLHLWNSDGTVIPVSPPYYFEIYEKASEILTHFYDIHTFKHISPWHHAAGDFVVRPTTDIDSNIKDFAHSNKGLDGNEQSFDVKLITVRGYSPIVEAESSEIDDDDKDNHIEDIYKALLLFFLNLTLRMRIDRIDGTGDRCLIDGDVIPFIFKGFFRSLDNKFKSVDSNQKIAFIEGFKSYLSQFSHENLYQIFLVMTDIIDSCDKDTFHQDSPETIFIKKHLKAHSEILSYNIRNTIFHV
ncbi:MAG: hypothetical protein HQK70_08280 [Desulfamplus sp.]|nr:hypothetical protein [Desulfamplus sp.]